MTTQDRVSVCPDLSRTSCTVRHPAMPSCDHRHPAIGGPLARSDLQDQHAVRPARSRQGRPVSPRPARAERAAVTPKAAATRAVAGASLILLLTACGGASTDTSTSAGCFRLNQAANDFNTAQDASKAGTSTDGDRAKAYSGVKSKLDDAALILPAGKLHDLAVTAATGVGQARVALLTSGSDSTGVSPSVAQGVDAAVAALNSAAPMCNGK